MARNLRAYEMVEDTSPEEISLMKQQRRIEDAQRLRRERKLDASGAGKPQES